jgi:hypothetical protein
MGTWLHSSPVSGAQETVMELEVQVMVGGFEYDHQPAVDCVGSQTWHGIAGLESPAAWQVPSMKQVPGIRSPWPQPFAVHDPAAWQLSGAVQVEAPERQTPLPSQ